ncbi:hypothetical protein COCOBI_pt-1650 (chloroplast) [Coccomyxa sp. Obi]|nr:hypothetical protein COCOBI_pt-1650 [Coccomyxa sp. Obi]
MHAPMAPCKATPSTPRQLNTCESRPSKGLRVETPTPTDAKQLPHPIEPPANKGQASMALGARAWGRFPPPTV